MAEPAANPLPNEASRAALAGVAGDRVPLHVVAFIVVSIGLLMLNASVLIINTAATMDSNADYARSFEIKDRKSVV